MRKLALLLLLTGIALPAFPARRVTVEQLQQVLSAVHGKSDSKAARQLVDLELTERLSAASLARAEANVPGSRARQALVALADESAFLDLPATEIPAIAAPDIDAQRKMMVRAVDYTGRTIHKLPNFFASRDTVFFEDNPTGRRADSTLIPHQSLHLVSRSSDTVFYRNGNEVVDSGKTKRKKYDPAEQSLVTLGVFGPILGIALVDASHGRLTWSHWEQGAAGPEAVFQYVVPREKSHYQVEFCCFPENIGLNHTFQKLSAYHGEIAVDPADGTILRLTVVADLEPADPIAKSNILVEYAPVEIGGKSYTCPIKSVSIWVAPALNSKALQTMLNDVTFRQYHLFRSESRLLIGNDGN